MTVVTAQDVEAAIRAELPPNVHVGVTKVQKLLYYAQAWHFTWTGEPLFSEAVEAWANGPVVEVSWRAHKNKRSISKPQQLDDAQLASVRHVCARYGRLSAIKLVHLTHQERPWKEAFDRGMNTEISLESMRDFFMDDPAADQQWFWTKDWLQGEKEAGEDVREGRVKTHDSDASFLESLN